MYGFNCISDINCCRDNGVTGVFEEVSAAYNRREGQSDGVFSFIEKYQGKLIFGLMWAKCIFAALLERCPSG
jgi:hypothetical protein